MPWPPALQLEVAVEVADDRYRLLRALVGRRLGVAAEAVAVQRAPCPACGGPHGRPVVPGTGLHVGVAAAGPVVAAAVAAAPVGVDVERVAAAGFAGFADVALHPAEHVPRDAVDAARTWVRKEAALKAAGVGLLVDPAAVRVAAPDGPARLLAWPRRPPGVRDGYLPLPRPGDVLLADVAAPAGFAAAVAVLPAR